MTKRAPFILVALILAVSAPGQAQTDSSSSAADSQEFSLFDNVPAASSVGWILSGNNLLNTNTGNVGIGTSNPLQKLHIEGVMRSNGVNSHSPLNPDQLAFLGFNSNGPYTFVTSWNSATASYQPIFLAGSKIGVATGSPTRVLDVNGDIGALNRFLVYYPTSAVYDNSTSDSPYSRVNADSLHTNGLGVGQLFLEGRAIDSNTIIYIGAGVAGGQGPQDVRLGNNDEVFVDTSLNNVGIGTSSPDAAYKLAVNGVIGAREVRVTQANWPDYVFEDAYPLPSLEEVEAAIRQQGHLPGVPSAVEVEAEGVGVGEMQALLLRKIEELTLYVLDLKKDNDALRARLDSLEVSP